MKPKRIQLKRVKGWKMPANTVKVDRSTPWGNPFTVEGIPYTQKGVFEGFVVRGIGYASEAFNDYSAAVSHALELFREHTKQLDAVKLRGKNLACWCRPEAACHADILLELANR